MTEIQIARIKSLYGDIKGLLAQIPQATEQGNVKDFVVLQFNQILEELTAQVETDFNKYAIPANQGITPHHGKYRIYDAVVVRTQIGRVVSRLEEEYGFGCETSHNSPTVAIFNKNQNEVSVQINYTFNDIIEELEGEEEKEQIRELRDELEKDHKNWEKIKEILIWCLNFSKDNFLKILPILLQKQL